MNVPVNTSARPAIIHILVGDADITLGEDAHRAGPGFWARMPADPRHSVLARTGLIMALYLLPREEPDARAREIVVNRPR